MHILATRQSKPAKSRRKKVNARRVAFLISGEDPSLSLAQEYTLDAAKRQLVTIDTTEVEVNLKEQVVKGMSRAWLKKVFPG